MNKPQMREGCKWEGADHFILRERGRTVSSHCRCTFSRYACHRACRKRGPTADTGIRLNNPSSETAGNDKRKRSSSVTFGVFCIALPVSASRLDRQPGAVYCTISSLRKKLKAHTCEEYIQTVPGMGYRFNEAPEA